MRIKRKSLIMIAVAFTAVSVLFTACNKDEKVTGVSVDPTELSIAVGGTATIVAIVLPSNADDKTVRWESKNPDIATVENGTVKGIKEGTTEIVCTTNDGGYQATTKVTVTSFVDYAELIVGTYNGTITLKPLPTPIIDDADIVVTHKSANKVEMKMNETFDVEIGGENGLVIDITCDADVSLKDGKYHITGTTEVVLMEGQPPLPVMVDGDFDDEHNAVINITVGEGSAMMEVIFETK